jgi:hypothetical protein
MLPRLAPALTTVLFLPFLVSACAGAAAANCNGNVADVGSTAVTTAQFNAQLRYTLGFYEHGNAGLKYYGVKICHDPSAAAVCRSVKSTLVSRMIDQQIVSDYAAAHNLQPTPAQWTQALSREAQLVRNTGGPAAFAAYLAKVGTDQAQFRFLESQQIETANVIRAMGPARFRSWLRRQDTAKSVSRCPI